MSLPTFSVSEINSYIKRKFDTDMVLQSVIISGEISNFNNHYKTGHLYFSLKDDTAAIKAVMFNRQAAKLRFAPENGMKVLAFGRVAVFERDGVYQIYVDALEPDGAGALAAAFEQLKKRLAAQGLFDEAHKKPIPFFPKKIGVITSPTGAAVQDIFNVTGRRFPIGDIVFCPVTVQGPAAPAEMIDALERLQKLGDIDVVIIGRGGGSMEDLWCFNDELLARAIYACAIPVISAVGHETDFTICDFVSDLRAPTPSAAAELAVPDLNGLLMELGSLCDRLYGAYERKLTNERRRLELILSVRDFTSPGRFFDNEKNAAAALTARLMNAAERIVGAEKLRLSKTVAALDTLNPLSVLLRGYAVVGADGGIVSSVNDIMIGQEIDITMADGVLNCRVLDKKVNHG
ncbi:MAG: exodeoxyribonuclease VII large subunit [Clostridia bacterium]|nr:exodeoxyribonuclease VII large subunit [Clostridia bacterium]